MPGEPETMGLLALMLLQDSRRAARTSDSGAPVPLAEQDRDRWNRAAIEESPPHPGLHPGPGAAPDRIGSQSTDRRPATPRAAQPEDTDWAAIAGLYAELAAFTPSPVVELNRAVAVAMADGPAAGLAIADDLAASGQLPGYHLLPAVRADLLRRLTGPPRQPRHTGRQSTWPAPTPNATSSSAA